MSERSNAKGPPRGATRSDTTPGSISVRPDYPIATPRLRLRPLSLNDTKELLAYRGRADVCRFLPFAPMNADVIEARLAGDLGRSEIPREGESLTLGVEVAHDGGLVGDVVLFFRSAKHGGGEIGYVFHPDFAGRGYATEACGAMLRLAFDLEEGLGLHRVVAQMDVRNHASARLASRLGMRQEAHFRSDRYFKGEWSDLIIYAILADEWNRGAIAP